MKRAQEALEVAREWTADLVVAEILDRRRHGTPLAFSRVPEPLRRAGITYFGSWREAIEVAGLRYADIRLVAAYSDEELGRGSGHNGRASGAGKRQLHHVDSAKPVRQFS